MHPIIHSYNILPGDRIVEPKSNLRWVQHHAIYLGQDYAGQDWIIENKVGIGVRVITAEYFFSKVIEITRIERFQGNGYERKLAVQKALDQVGKSYDLINFNCEHFANYVQHNTVNSRQVASGVGLGLLALFALAALASD